MDQANNNFYEIPGPIVSNIDSTVSTDSFEDSLEIKVNKLINTVEVEEQNQQITENLSDVIKYVIRDQYGNEVTFEGDRKDIPAGFEIVKIMKLTTKTEKILSTVTKNIKLEENNCNIQEIENQGIIIMENNSMSNMSQGISKFNDPELNLSKMATAPSEHCITEICTTVTSNNNNSFDSVSSMEYYDSLKGQNIKSNVFLNNTLIDKNHEDIGLDTMSLQNNVILNENKMKQYFINSNNVLNISNTSTDTTMLINSEYQAIDSEIPDQHFKSFLEDLSDESFSMDSVQGSSKELGSCLNYKVYQNSSSQSLLLENRPLSRTEYDSHIAIVKGMFFLITKKVLF